MLPTDQSQSCTMNYTHLTQKERYQIYALLREGFSKRHIAFRLCRAPSTITREIKRNRNRNGYFAKHAHKLACECIKSNPTLIRPNLWYDVEKYLNIQWSPKQISSQIGVSFTSIYRCIQKDKIAGGFFYTHLHFLNQRKRKYGHPETQGQISNRKNIRKRSDLNHYTNEYIAEITYR